MKGFQQNKTLKRTYEIAGSSGTASDTRYLNIKQLDISLKTRRMKRRFLGREIHWWTFFFFYLFLLDDGSPSKSSSPSLWPSERKRENFLVFALYPKQDSNDHIGNISSTSQSIRCGEKVPKRYLTQRQLFWTFDKGFIQNLTERLRRIVEWVMEDYSSLVRVSALKLAILADLIIYPFRIL